MGRDVVDAVMLTWQDDVQVLKEGDVPGQSKVGVGPLVALEAIRTKQTVVVWHESEGRRWGLTSCLEKKKSGGGLHSRWVALEILLSWLPCGHPNNCHYSLLRQTNPISKISSYLL